MKIFRWIVLPIAIILTIVIVDALVRWLMLDFNNLYLGKHEDNIVGAVSHVFDGPISLLAAVLIAPSHKKLVGTITPIFMALLQMLLFCFVAMKGIATIRPFNIIIWICTTIIPYIIGWIIAWKNNFFEEDIS